MMFRVVALTSLLLIILHGYAHQPEAIQWQPGHLINQSHALTSLFSARQKGYKPTVRASGFDGSVNIIGQPGQHFVLCADSVESRGYQTEVTPYDTPTHFAMTMAESAETLLIKGSRRCPLFIRENYYYHFQGFIYSSQPFAVKARNNKHRPDNNTAPSLPVWGNAGWKNAGQPSLLSSLGGSYGDTDNDDKPSGHYPPYFQPGSTEWSLILLPLLPLPRQWLDYMPGSHWYHRLTGESDHSGIEIVLRFHDQTPQRIHISQAEYSELSRHLLSTRQLLLWLAPKLSGRESMIDRLLQILSLMEESGIADDNNTRMNIEKELNILLHQPDTEFSLEFEWQQLSSIITASVDPFSAVISAQGGKGEKKASGASGGDSGSSGESGSQGSHSGETGGGSDASQQQIPSDDESQQPQKNAENKDAIIDRQQNYVLSVGIDLYLLPKEELNEPVKVPEDIRVQSIKEDSWIPLLEMEHKSGIDEFHRIPPGSDALEYLYHYGEIYGEYNALLDYHEKFLDDWGVPKSELDHAPRTLFAALNKRSNTAGRILAHNVLALEPVEYARRYSLKHCLNRLEKLGLTQTHEFHDDGRSLLSLTSGARETFSISYGHSPEGDIFTDAVDPVELVRLIVKNDQIRQHYVNNQHLPEIILKRLTALYFENPTQEWRQKVKRWRQEQRESVEDNLKSAGVPDFLIKLSRKNDLYSLALLRCLSSLKILIPFHRSNLYRSHFVLRNPLPQPEPVTWETGYRVGGNNAEQWQKYKQQLDQVFETFGEQRYQLTRSGTLMLLTDGRLVTEHKDEGVSIWTQSTRREDSSFCELVKPSQTLVNDEVVDNSSGTIRHRLIELPGNRLAIPQTYRIGECWSYIEIRDTVSGNVLNVLDDQKADIFTLFIAEGHLAFLSLDNFLRLWKLDSSNGSLQIKDDYSRMRRLPNYRLLTYTTGIESFRKIKETGSDKEWDFEAELPGNEYVRDLDFLPDSSLAFISSNPNKKRNKLKVFNVKTKKTETVANGKFDQLVVLIDGRIAVNNENTIYLDDQDLGSCLEIYNPARPNACEAYINTHNIELLSFVELHDGSLALSQWFRPIEIWELYHPAGKKVTHSIIERLKPEHGADKEQAAEQEPVE